jgi:phage I-like protein
MNSETIHAQWATPLPEAPPEDIQWMPPGTHEIDAWQGGKPVRVKVRADAATAERMQKHLQAFRSKAAAGTEDKPYIDFNHEDGPAAGHITEFFWAGDDPVTGGVRAKVEWTEPGKQALQGRAYRRFSPSFNPPNAAGEVTGAPLNMGGLVNRAAFKTIAPIVSRDAAEGPTTQHAMDNTKELADLQAAMQAKDTQIAALEKQVADLKSDQTIQAKDAEITDLKAKMSGLENTIKAHTTEKAKAKGQAAIQAGRLPPQATDIHAKWAGLIEQDEANATLLESLPVQAALGTVIVNGAGAGAGPTIITNTAQGFVEAVKAKCAAGKTKSQALDAAIAEAPEAYKAWRTANGQPAL